MSGPEFRRFMMIALILSVGAGLSSASAQPAGTDPVRENERLRTDLENTRQELEAARRRIVELEREVDRLKGQLDRRDQQPAGDAPEKDVTIDETDPAASPRALFRSIVADYEEVMEGLTIGRAGDRDRALYMRGLVQWRAAVNRKYRLPLVWHVRVLDAVEERGRTRSVTLIAVDPKTGAELGDSFEMQVPANVSRRYDQLRARGAMDVLVLRGVIGPSVRINEDRPDAGIFDRPRFVGPFVEFILSIEPRSLLPASEDDGDQP